MGLFTNPLGYAGYPPGVTGTPMTQPSEVRAATVAEAVAATLDSVYISPLTAASIGAGANFASPGPIGSTTPNTGTFTTLAITTSTAHGVLIGEAGTGVVSATPGTNGQVLLGSTGADPAFGTLTTSTGLAFTTGAHSLALNVLNGGYAVVPVAGTSQALAIQSSYIANAAGQTTFTLPATAAVGSIIRVSGSALNTGGFVIAQGASQVIWGPAGPSTVGATGTLTSAGAAAQSVTLECVVANTTYIIVGNSGTMVLA